jgi:hypothetical protein
MKSRFTQTLIAVALVGSLGIGGMAGCSQKEAVANNVPPVATYFGPLGYANIYIFETKLPSGMVCGIAAKTSNSNQNGPSISCAFPPK